MRRFYRGHTHSVTGRTQMLHGKASARGTRNRRRRLRCLQMRRTGAGCCDLLRWFIISYGGPTRLFIGHGFVGWVKEGVNRATRRDDPLLVALQESIIQINAHVRDLHEDLRGRR